jgi:hypothetical protein
VAELGRRAVEQGSLRVMVADIELARSSSVSRKQATYDEALGARGMLSLQSYEQEEPVSDNNVYTITSTYRGATLKLYTSYPGRPISPGGRPEFYTHQLNTWGMTGNIENLPTRSHCLQKRYRLGKGAEG